MRDTLTARRGRGTRALAALAVAALVLAAANPAHSQTAALGVLRGVAVDSLRGGTLADAFVVVEGTGRGAGTDAEGRFMVDSIPAGSYRVILMHPLLDTLGIGVVTRPVRFARDDTVAITLAVPSRETILSAKCGPSGPQGPQAALIGTVIDSDSDAPVENATVVVAWTQVQFGTDIGLRRTPRQRVARSRADGTFRICGLPPELSAELYAARGADTTAPLPLSFEHPLLAIRTLVLPSAIELAAAKDSARAVAGVSATAPILLRGSSVVRGKVTTVAGASVAGARVSVAGAAGATVTDANGDFTLAGQPAGSQVLTVRRLGYAAVQEAVNLNRRYPQTVRIRIAEFVPVLATVEVKRGLDAGLERVGFTSRQRTRSGYYLNPEQLERRPAQRVVDLLRDAPMLRVLATGGIERTVVGRRGGCVTFVVDGVPWMGLDQPTEYMNPSEIGAIEAYSTAFTPGEFTQRRTCETVVIWTKSKLGIR